MPFQQIDFASFVDLENYPILDLSGPKAGEVIRKYQKQIDTVGAAEITHFVTPVGIQRMIQESEAIETRAFHNALIGNAYLDDPDPSLAADHVRKMVEPTSLGAVGYDQIPKSHLLRQLYEWPPLMEFIRQILKLDQFYPYGDPMGALNIAVMKDGDYLRWHFDQTDFVVSLSIRNANEGGEFEYVPLIRSQANENYEKIRALLKGSPNGVLRIANRPGTLVLFKGRYSIHRVTPIRGSVSRLMGLLGYDTKPGTMSSEYLRKIRYGRTKPESE